MSNVGPSPERSLYVDYREHVQLERELREKLAAHERELAVLRNMWTTLSQNIADIKTCQGEIKAKLEQWQSSSMVLSAKNPDKITGFENALHHLADSMERRFGRSGGWLERIIYIAGVASIALLTAQFLGWVDIMSNN